MQRVSRRSFLINAGTCLALYPLVQALSGCDGSDFLSIEAKDAFRVLNDNGQNLAFYFLNTKSNQRLITPGDEPTGSFMIIQLPPQSFHEEYIEGAAPTAQGNAKLARHSFLAFQLWPELNGSARRLEIRPDALMNWKDERMFKLLTTADIKTESIKSFSLKEQVADVTLDIANDDVECIGLAYYLKVLSGIFHRSEHGNQYISLFELPAELYLVPHISGANFRAKVVQNDYRISRNEYKITQNGIVFRRVLQERWNLELRFEQKEVRTDKILINTLPPVLRAIAIRSSKFSLGQRPTNECATYQEEAKYLPTLLDKVELVFLNQIYNSTYSSKDYDIKLKSKCLFTSTGASLKFHYKNHVSGHANISLVEYEHHFQDGRDNYIKIARIGVLAPFGHKALHVKIAKRVVSPAGIAYMELKHYVEVIQPDVSYPVTKADFNQQDVLYRTMFSNVSIDEYEEDRKTTYYNRHPFSGATALVTRTQPIESPASDCELFFWVYREGTTDPNVENLQPMPFECRDRNGKPFQTLVSVLFIRKDFFASSTAVDSFLGGGQPANAYLSGLDDGRLKIPLNNQIVSFTPDDPEAAVDEEIKNKINQLPAEYIEYYINIAQPKSGTPSRDFFDTVPHIIYLQMRRTKASVEQIQQYSREKLPSVITYPIDYLEHEFNREKNKAKLVMKHTRDFIDGQLKDLSGNVLTVVEQDLSNGYQRIQDVFTKAEERIGGLVNPDVQIERFALVKEALTLPKDVNRQWEKFQNKSQRLLNTAEMLKGKSAEILGGIDLKMLLEEVLGIEETPQFQLNKIAGAIQNIEKFLNEFKNPVVTKVLDTVRNIDQFLTKAMNEVNAVVVKLKEYEEKLTSLRRQLHDTLEDVSHMRNAAKLLYEEQRLQFIDALDANSETVEEHLRHEVASELSKITGVVDKVDTIVTDELNKLVDYCVLPAGGLLLTLNNLVNTLPENERVYVSAIIAVLNGEAGSLLNQYKTTCREILRNAAITGTYTYPGAKDYFNKQVYCYESGNLHYIKLAPDLTKNRIRWDDIKWNQVVSSDSDFSNVDSFGLYQLQQLELYFQAVHPTDVARFRTRIATLQNNLNNSAYKIASRVYDQVAFNYAKLNNSINAEVKNGLDTVLKLVDVVRKSNTKFYIDRYRTLKKDYEDIRKKIRIVETVLPKLQEIQKDPTHYLRVAAKQYNDELKSYGQQLLAENVDKRRVQEQVIRLNSKVEHFSLLLDLQIEKGVELYIRNYPAAAEALKFIKEIKQYQELLEHPEKGVKKLLKEKEAYYKQQLELQAKSMLEQLESRFKDEITKLTNTEEVQAAKREYERFIDLLASVRKQEMNYSWSTDKFRKANIGIIRFTPDTNPKTKLAVDVRNTVYLDPLKLPPVVEKVEASAVNTLTNFNITFLNVITVGFTHLQFITGTAASPKLTVKIRDVKFDGALSFIQKLEDLLKSLGEGFKLEIKPTGVGIGYMMPIPAVSSPCFTFANITLGVLLNIHFDRKPMSLKFMLAEPENKAIVAAGILGGGFYCSLTAEPKRGIRHIQMALEMGAYLGVSIGPIRGEVKIMVGLSYEKDDYGVTLEGYIIALGRLSVWIINVTAKIVLYVRSQNSYVEGACTVTYSAKLGFLRKSFTGTFRKKVAGAQKVNQSESRIQMNEVIKSATRQAFLLPAAVPALREFTFNIEDYFEERPYQVMDKPKWTAFYQQFFQ